MRAQIFRELFLFASTSNGDCPECQGAEQTARQGAQGRGNVNQGCRFESWFRAMPFPKVKVLSVEALVITVVIPGDGKGDRLVESSGGKVLVGGVECPPRSARSQATRQAQRPTG